MVLILLPPPIEGDNFLVALMELMNSRGQSLFKTLECECECDDCRKKVEYCEHNE